MIIHCWTVLCNRSIIDKPTNNITLVDVVEQFQLDTGGGQLPPFFPISVELVSLWSRDSKDEKEKGTARFRFASPEGKILEEIGSIGVDLTAFRRNRTIFRIVGLPPLTASGLYYFVTEFQSSTDEKWTEVSRLPLDVIINTLQTETTSNK